MVGVTHLIVTNAVGGINPAYQVVDNALPLTCISIILLQVGDIMLVKDHINMFSLAAESPLRGPNDESFGPRFFSINDLYSKKWRNIAKAAAEEVGDAQPEMQSDPPLLSSGWDKPHCARGSAEHIWRTKL